MTKRPAHTSSFEPEELERSLDRHFAWGLVFIVVLAVAFPIYRLREPHLRSDAKVAEQKSYQDLGQSLFATGCAGCHGKGATGGGSAPTLDSKEFLSSVADNQIQLIVSTGVPGTDMSPWSLDFGGNYTAEQIKAIVTYLRSLEKTAPSIPTWRQSTKAP
jgi:mono/diheme cytochrome c family protein